jgi:hypothetical protein
LQYAATLLACTQKVTKDDLKGYIKTQIRFDLEQAAALVISAMLTAGQIADATRLVKELGTVLATSSTWVADDETQAVNKPADASFNASKLAQQLKDAAAHRRFEIPLPSDLSELLSLLMRVRRCRPDNRCLYIPKWMFEAAGMDAPNPFHDFFADVSGKPYRTVRSGEQPTAAKQEDSIVLTRKHFRAMQRRIFCLYQFWKPAVVHARRVRDLADRVLYASVWIDDRVFATEDVALICHFFFASQRRLQRKVVGAYDGPYFNTFLAKGQGSQIYQNNVTIISTFERVLQEIAESNEMGVLVTMGYENTIKLIDETCLLMKEYVDLYGGGKSENLVFRPYVRGGSGRGPVDRYNLLCTVLSHLREQARAEGVEDLPGPTHKFLAKDIMYYNKSWKDDAFARNKEPGWKGWLRKRELEEDEWVLM